MTPTSDGPALADVSLDDKYTHLQGEALMTGMQALVRLPLTLHERAQRAGLRLGGYISGYRGSPVGTYDIALWAAKAHLAPRNIQFQPGVNEELAATAVWGSQQARLLGGSDFDGVFGLWYGKSPGVDRSLDVFRHANYAGTSPHGGVLAIAGDDPNAVSSTVTGCSDQTFAAVGMPVLYPANVQEMLDFGVLGIELSRFSGCWVALKAVTDIAESSAIVDLNIARVNTEWLADDQAPADVHIRWPDNRVEQERRLYETKLVRAKQFARLSGINTVTVAPPSARWGIVSAGKPWADLMQALLDLGLTEQRLADSGVRVLKLGMIYPLDESQIKAFAQGLDTLLVVEEKRGFIEDQIKGILFGASPCPQVLGKQDADGTPLIAQHGETSPALLAQVLSRVFSALTRTPQAQARLALLQGKALALLGAPAQSTRTPFFCSGCPHNSSTMVPEGSVALGAAKEHYRHPDAKTYLAKAGSVFAGVKWNNAGPKLIRPADKEEFCEPRPVVV